MLQCVCNCCFNAALLIGSRSVDTGAQPAVRGQAGGRSRLFHFVTASEFIYISSVSGHQRP